MDKIKYFFASLAAFLGGGILIAGPDTIPEEIPYHVEIGIAFIAFGCLMIAALYSTRVKNLMVAAIFGAISVGLILVAVSGDLDLWKRIVFGVLGTGNALFFLYCLVTAFTGHDLAGRKTDNPASD